jgi:hypothetical protein
MPRWEHCQTTVCGGRWRAQGGREAACGRGAQWARAGCGGRRGVQWGRWWAREGHGGQEGRVRRQIWISEKRNRVCKRDGEEIHKEMDFSATPSLVHTHIFILYKINLHGIIYNQSIINPLYTFYEYTTEYPILPKSPEFVSFYLYDIFHVIYLILSKSPPQSQLI